MKRLFLIATAVLLIVSCKRVPNEVLDQKHMESILYEMHKAEGLMDERGAEFATKEAKQKLLIGVLEENGTTKAQFDSSLVWYGQHLNLYMKIYGNVISRLELEDKDYKDAWLAYEKSLLTPVGDSVDIWKNSAEMILEPSLLATNSTFAIRVDSNFHEQDTLTWRMRFNYLPADSVAIAYVTLGLRQNSGKLDTLNTAFVKEDGYFDIGFRAKAYPRSGSVFGSVTLLNQIDTIVGPVYIDQISLIRMHQINPPAADTTRLDSKIVADSLKQDSLKQDSLKQNSVK